MYPNLVGLQSHNRILHFLESFVRFHSPMYPKVHEIKRLSQLHDRRLFSTTHFNEQQFRIPIPSASKMENKDPSNTSNPNALRRISKRDDERHFVNKSAGLSVPFPKKNCVKNPDATRSFFFHEYGRRVGMVPRSSLKGGKNSLMVEKRTRRPNTTQTKKPKAHRPSLHHHVVFPLC